MLCREIIHILHVLPWQNSVKIGRRHFAIMWPQMIWYSDWSMTIQIANDRSSSSSSSQRIYCLCSVPRLLNAHAQSARDCLRAPESPVDIQVQRPGIWRQNMTRRGILSLVFFPHFLRNEEINLHLMPSAPVQVNKRFDEFLLRHPGRWTCMIFHRR
jgi:hypothetical protein